MADETNSPSRPWSHDLKRADYLHPDSIENKLGLGRVPPEPQEGILWRGMSGGEFKNLLNQGFLKSKGDWNISNTQKGLTIFSSNPRTAEMYAHDFAPRDFKATPGSSAYVVGIKKPSGAIPQTQKNPSEFGIKGRIPIEDIVSVYRGGVFSPKSDRERAVLDWQEIPVSDLLDAASYSGFEKWFGDSKVVDKTGEPLVLYRGLTGSSTKDFPDAALAGEPRPGYATFLSDNAKVAGSYAAVNDPLGFQSAGTIVPVYVKADEVIEFHNTRENEYGHFNMFEFDRQAMNLRPGQVLVARNVRDSGPHASLEADPDYGWQARADTYAVGPGTQMRSAISKGITPEPRPPDQSNLPALIDAASAASQLARTQTDEPRPKGKGEIFRGIGSLMRRRMFPLIQAAQMGWDALPEDKKKEVQDFLSRPAHELVGMEKPGIEYFKDLLGISEEDLPQSTMRAAGEVNPNPDEPELSIDNPGGAWLQGKLDQAQEDYRTAPVDSARRKVGSSVVTAWFSDPLDLPPDLLKKIPGALGEEAFRESGVKLENLQKSIRERGYEESPILIHVREDGQPFIIEGNHRVVEAVLSKRSTIPVSLRYLRGGETADGLLSPQKIKDFYSKRLGSRMADE